jgi:ketosteroid isomerase-like protein
MSEESTTVDPVEPVRNVFAFGNRRAYDALQDQFASDCVLDLSRQGLGTYDGATAVRAFCEDWIEVYEEFVLTAAELVALDHGVVLTVNRHSGRLLNSNAQVILDNAWVFVCRDAAIVLWTAYNDVAEARAAAERLAEERA